MASIQLVALYTGQLEAAAAPLGTFTTITQVAEVTFFVAYIVDLLVVCGLGVVPYSRCDPVKGGRDIIVHHVPSIIGGSLLRYAQVEMMTGPDAIEVASILARWRGWSMLSSYNEVIMCMQRVDWPAAVWNSRRCYLIELSWKVLIFTVFAGLGTTAAVQMFSRLLASTAEGAATSLEVASNMASSPLAWAILIYLVFYATMYPSMGWRAIRKLSDVATGRIRGTPPGAPHGYPRDEPRKAARAARRVA